MRNMTIRDDELIKMAAFKLGDAARRVALLAKEAETPRLRQLLTESSAALDQQAQELQGDVETLARGSRSRSLAGLV